MIQVFGENYYLDLEKIDEFINLPNQEPSGTTETQHISILKYEMVKLLIEVILSEQDEVDEKLGLRSTDKLTIPYRLSWNTMLFYKFLQKL
jgi:hypothetical protein